NGKGDRPGPRGQAEARWHAALDALRGTKKQPGVEEQRLAYQAWYADQLLILDKGVNRANQVVTPSVKRLVYQKGVLQTDQAGVPRLDVVKDKGEKPLAARVGLEREQDRLHQEIEKELALIQALIKQADDLTRQLKELFTHIQRQEQ